MNKPLKLVSTAIIGLIVVGITTAVFFLGTAAPRTTLDWLSLLFLLFSEFLVFGMLIYLTISASSSSQRIIRAGILSTIGIYWLISIVLVFLRNLFTEHQNTFIITNIILIGIVIIISLLLNMTASKVRLSESKTSIARLLMQDIEKRLFSLKTNSDHMEFIQGIASLYEKVKFSDKVGNSSYDEAIYEELDNLEMALHGIADDKKEKVDNSISQILFFLKQRNMELSQSKRGEF